MNEKQKKAIANFKRALTNMGKTGLCVYGMDETLLVVKSSIQKRETAKGTQNDITRWGCRLTSDNMIIIRSPHYIDSGGW